MLNKSYSCNCGNPKLGFDCICLWVSLHPGHRSFCCEFCGCYQSASPRCNKCEEFQEEGE